ncbi:ABC transporter permease [Pasteuria penetrans]|uniref:ABC transporter permease n=1 Tax=Pasteuria penetrans TaxID=86005 RepID=UPI000FBFAE54|nr:ABC transporter permease [Pasteuria penetrans]
MNTILRYFRGNSTIVTAVISIVLGLCVGALALMAIGHNPWTAYRTMFMNSLAEPYGVGESLVAITPLILTGLAVALAYGSGLFNIGVEGQLIVGQVAAYAVAHQSPFPGVVTVPLAILAGMVAGAAWGGVLGWLKTWRGVHEVISGIMMNFMALYLSNVIIRQWFSVNRSITSEVLPESTHLNWEFFSQISGGSRLHVGFILALLAVVLMHILLSHTRWGFKIRVTGQSPQAASYAGISSRRVTLLVLVLSGSLAGLAGVCEVLGSGHRITVLTGFEMLGFDGIAVAFLGAATPLGVVLAATLFGVLRYGAKDLLMIDRIPTEISQIVLAAILFMVAANISNRLFARWRSWRRVGSQRVQ